MSEKTNEELAAWLDAVSMQAPDLQTNYAAVAAMLREAAARLRQQSEAIDYMTARRAISLFNHEFAGQDGKELWAWALSEARNGNYNG